MVAVWQRAWRWRLLSRGGGGGPRQPCGSSITSGTTHSTINTTTTASDSVGDRARGFHLLPALVVEQDAEETIIGQEDDISEETTDAAAMAKKLEHIKGLVVEFCGGDGNNLSALERWLAELDVGWVLHLPANDAAGSILVSQQLQRLTVSWILALFKINKYVSRCSKSWYREEGTAVVSPPAAYEFVRFIKAIFLRMLLFSDAVVSLNISRPSREKLIIGVIGKLQVLIDIREALSTASYQNLFTPCSSSPCAESTHEMRDLLSAELGKLDQAIWESMDEIRTIVMSLTGGGGDDDGNCSSDTAKTRRRLPDIHRITRTVTSFVKVLCISYRSVNPIVCEASLHGKYVPACGYADPLTNLIMEMVRCLEGKLVRKSQSYSDQSLRYLFLINNFHFIGRHIQRSWVPEEATVPDLTGEIDKYIQNYLQASWAPVLKCLRHPATVCFARHSPLAKFESKFQRTYSAQKLWKVPDPEMRMRLRKAITTRVCSGYTRFLEHSSFDSPRLAPKELKKMLEELFEG